VNNFKMDMQQLEWGGINWTDLAQDRNSSRAPVNAVTTLRMPQNAGGGIS